MASAHGVQHQGGAVERRRVQEHDPGEVINTCFVSASITRTPVARPVAVGDEAVGDREGPEGEASGGRGRGQRGRVAGEVGAERAAPLAEVPGLALPAAVVGLAQDGRAAGDELTVAEALHEPLRCASRCSSSRTAAAASRRGAEAARVLAAHPDERLHVVVPGLDVLVANRPVDAHALRGSPRSRGRSSGSSGAPTAATARPPGSRGTSGSP